MDKPILTFTIFCYSDNINTYINLSCLAIFMRFTDALDAQTDKQRRRTCRIPFLP